MDLINVCSCCLILLFLLTRFLNNVSSHQSNASFFTPLSLNALEAIFLFIHHFFLNICFLGGFLSVPHLVDNYAKKWMNGVGTLCAIAHYRASLFLYNFDQYKSNLIF